MKLKMLGIFLLMSLVGCSGLQKNFYMAPKEVVKAADLKVGTPINEIKAKFWGEPITYTFNSPDGSGKQLTILQCENEVEEYMNKGPMWTMFEDGKLITHGLGDAKHAELTWYFAYYDYLLATKKMGLADAERAKYKKNKSMYQLTSYEDEYYTYRIVVAGKLERKEIDSDESNYLIAEKKANLDSRLDTARNNAIAIAQTNELIGLQRATLLMQSMHSINRQPTHTSCVTNGFGSTWFTNCY